MQLLITVASLDLGYMRVVGQQRSTYSTIRRENSLLYPSIVGFSAFHGLAKSWGSGRAAERRGVSLIRRLSESTNSALVLSLLHLCHNTLSLQFTIAQLSIFIIPHHPEMGEGGG